MQPARNFFIPFLTNRNLNPKRSMKILKSILTLILLLIALIVFTAPSAQAQPYYTNSTPANGAYLYNDVYAISPKPSAVLAQQYKSGILTGNSVTTTDGTVTNTFATNVVYTVFPSIQVTQVGSTITTTDVVTSVTTSNFVYRAGAPGITNCWISVGH
jgi:hypothetical protein